MAVSCLLVFASALLLALGAGERIKVGRCPQAPVGTWVEGHSRDTCDDDYDCDGVMKCCRTVIGRTCMLPKDYEGDGTPGHCPQPFTYWVECASGCQPSCDTLGQNRPCHLPCFTGCVCLPGYVRQYDSANAPCIPIGQCPPSQKAFEKFGACPRMPTDQVQRRRQDSCSNDFSCSGYMKCCETVIGKACMLPLCTCPDGQRTSLFCDVNERCPLGYQCKSGLCCPVKGAYGWYGRYPVSTVQTTIAWPQRPVVWPQQPVAWPQQPVAWPPMGTQYQRNQCPHYAYVGSWAQVARPCSADAHCTAGQRCCYTYFGNRCLQVASTRSNMKLRKDSSSVNSTSISCPS